MKNVGKCFKDTTGSPGPKIETNNTNKNKNYREHRLLKVQKERKPRWHSFHFIENFVSTRLELLFILRINLHIKCSKSTATNQWVVPDLPALDLDQYNSTCRKIWNGKLIVMARRSRSKQKKKHKYIYLNKLSNISVWRQTFFRG